MSEDANVGGQVLAVDRRTFAGADYIVTLLESKRWEMKAGRDLLGFGCGGAVLAIDLLLRAEDAAPFLVIGHRHAALDTDPNPLTRLGFFSEQFVQQGHQDTLL
jgi:hypothetical protein